MFHKYFFRLLDWRRCLVINMSFPLSYLVNTDASQLNFHFSASHVNENVWLRVGQMKIWTKTHSNIESKSKQRLKNTRAQHIDQIDLKKAAIFNSYE